MEQHLSYQPVSLTIALESNITTQLHIAKAMHAQSPHCTQRDAETPPNITSTCKHQLIIDDLLSTAPAHQDKTSTQTMFLQSKEIIM